MIGPLSALFELRMQIRDWISPMGGVLAATSRILGSGVRPATQFSHLSIGDASMLSPIWLSFCLPILQSRSLDREMFSWQRCLESSVGTLGYLSKLPVALSLLRQILYHLLITLPRLRKRQDWVQLEGFDIGQCL